MDFKAIGAGVFWLILAFLLLSNGSAADGIFNALGSQATNAVQTLQGRGGNGLGGLASFPTGSNQAQLV